MSVDLSVNPEFRRRPGAFTCASSWRKEVTGTRMNRRADWHLFIQPFPRTHLPVRRSGANGGYGTPAVLGACLRAVSSSHSRNTATRSSLDFSRVLTT